MPFRNLPFVSGSHIIIKLICAMISAADHQYYYCSIISAVFQEFSFIITNRNLYHNKFPRLKNNADYKVLTFHVKLVLSVFLLYIINDALDTDTMILCRCNRDTV